MAGIPATGKVFHQSVASEFTVQRKDSPYENDSGNHTERDTKPGGDSADVKDDKEDKFG